MRHFARGCDGSCLRADLQRVHQWAKHEDGVKLAVRHRLPAVQPHALRLAHIIEHEFGRRRAVKVGRLAAGALRVERAFEFIPRVVLLAQVGDEEAVERRRRVGLVAQPLDQLPRRRRAHRRRRDREGQLEHAFLGGQLEAEKAGGPSRPIAEAVLAAGHVRPLRRARRAVCAVQGARTGTHTRTHMDMGGVGARGAWQRDGSRG
jgi:hypothetical protein